MAATNPTHDMTSSMNAHSNYSPGDRVKFHDRSYKPTRLPRYGTVVSVTPGDPTTVQLRMDEGSELHTLVENLIPIRSRGINFCCCCNRGADVIFHVHGTTIFTCAEHKNMTDLQLLLQATAQTCPKRAWMTDLPPPGTVVDHPTLGLYLITGHSAFGVTGRFANGSTHSYDKATILKHFTLPTK